MEKDLRIFIAMAIVLLSLISMSSASTVAQVTTSQTSNISSTTTAVTSSSATTASQTSSTITPTTVTTTTSTQTSSATSTSLQTSTTTITITSSSQTTTSAITTATRSIALNPSSAQVGSTVLVSGSGFSSSDTGCLLSGGGIASQTCMISGGTLTASFVVANVPAGGYTITVIGSTGDSASATFIVSIVTPSIVLNPAYATVGAMVTVSGSGFYASDTACSFSGVAITAQTCSISGGSLTGSFTVANTAPGSYHVTVTTNGADSGLAAANFQVVSSSPSISLNPTSVQVGATVSVFGSGFSASDTGCSLSGVAIVSETCTISGGTLTASFVVANLGAGSYTVTATGSLGDSASSTFTVSVVTTTSTTSGLADFTIASSTAIVTLTQGGSGLATITVNSVNGFNSPVTLLAAWLGSTPTGVTVMVTSPVTPVAGGSASSTLSITASSIASTGTFTVRVIGMSGSLTHDVTPDFTVQITPAVTTTSASSTVTTVSTIPIPQCLIATATYGSDLAPEVQILRNFRDNSIMKTMAGSSFMIAFNTWYYSFSPYVASYLQANLAERTVMKVVLYPLIGILWLSSGTFDIFRTYPEVAALLSGLLATSLIGAVYVAVPFALIRTKVKRLRDSRRQRLVQISLAITLCLGLAGLGLGEVLLRSLILIPSTVTIILSALFLTSIITSNKISNVLQRKMRKSIT